MSVNNVNTQQEAPRSLEKHTKVVHKGIMYSCIECEYRTREPGSVRDHMFLPITEAYKEEYLFITHNGIKFLCPDCDYQTGKRDTLKEHAKNIHKRILNRPYFNSLNSRLKSEPEIPTKKVLYQVFKHKLEVKIENGRGSYQMRSI